MEQKNLTMAGAHLVLIDQILQWRKQYQAVGNAAVIRSECKSSLLVKNLRQKGDYFNFKKQTRLLPSTVNEQKEVIVLRERIWGLKIGNQLVFDVGNYSLQALLKVALNIPMAKIYSDSLMCYYSNGRRVLRAVKPIALVNNFRNPPLNDWLTINWEAAEKFFPEETAQLLHDYPNIKPKHWRLMTDSNVETLVIAQDENYDYYIPFQCLLNGDNIDGSYCNNIITRLNGYGNLQPLFHEFSKMLNANGYQELQKDPSLRCFERTYYTNTRQTAKHSDFCRIIKSLETLADNKEEKEYPFYEPSVNKIELAVGFADIPYEQAFAMSKDKTELKRRFIAGERVFCVNVEGKIIDSRNVVNSRYFKIGNGCRIILIPDNVYEAWGREFSPQMVEALSRNRNFDYNRYGNDYMRNICGRERQQFNTVKRVAKAVVGGAKLVAEGTGFVVETAGTAAGVFLYLGLEAADSIFDKVAYAIEPVEQVEGTGAHYSSPERRGCITGRYH